MDLQKVCCTSTVATSPSGILGKLSRVPTPWHATGPLMIATLNTKKLANVLKTELPEWRQGVADYGRDTLERIPCNLSS